MKKKGGIPTARIIYSVKDMKNQKITIKVEQCPGNLTEVQHNDVA